MFSVKDNLAVRNQPMSCGSLFLSDYRPIHSATLVSRMLAAGAVLVGHCNMDEFAMGTANLNSAFGPVYNPWGQERGQTDPSLRYPRVAGGSSGGPAVSVLTGQSQVSLASDTAGSIRLPASFCGVVGFKPSYGALGRHGLVPLVSSMDCSGILARRVQEVTRVFRAVVGSDSKDSTSVSISECNHSDRTLRVGLTLHNNASGVEECVKLRLGEAIEDLVSCYDVTTCPVALPYADYYLPTYNTLSAVEVASNMAKYSGVVFGGTETGTEEVLGSGYRLANEAFSDRRASLLGAIVKYRIILGTYFSSEYGLRFHSQAARMRQAIVRGFSHLFRTETNPSGCDVIITPAAPGPAPYSNTIREIGPIRASLLDYFLLAPSFAGNPAVSIPIGLSEEGMPLGLQVVGGVGRDYEVLRVAEMVQESNRHTDTMRRQIETLSL